MNHAPDEPPDLASRLWRKDASLWHTPPDTHAAISARLGWLDSIEWMQERAGALQAWAAGIAESGECERVIVLGMGGSSLAPAVFASLFAPAPGYPSLTTLDTTHPQAVAALATRTDSDLRRCLFIVSSKSGDTIETVSLYRFFRAQLARRHPSLDASSRFVLITDAGSPLHRSGEFGTVFLNRDDIGGRYSALSYFGLAPAALLGVDIVEVLARARRFAERTRADDPQHNPALALGLLLGRSACAGRDKLILRLAGELRAFGGWVEQLLAESCGKDGKGLVPVCAAAGADFSGVADTLTIDIGYGGGGGDGGDDSDYRLHIRDPEQIGAEYFRWEFATAIAATCLRVNPFDQPAVALAKDNTARFLRGEMLSLPSSERGVHYDITYPGGGDGNTTAQHTEQFRRTLGAQNYLAALAYLPEEAAVIALLQSLCERITARHRIIATCGIGPRYLHSTGQLHKDGPPTGRFIQLLADDDGADVAIPGGDTFGRLYRAQADGDFAALADARRGEGVIMRVTLKADRLRALAAFVDDFVPDTATPA